MHDFMAWCFSKQRDKFTLLGFTKLGHKRNSDARERLKATVVDEEQQRHKKKKKKKTWGENGKRPPSVDIPLHMEGQAEGRRRDKCHPGTRRNTS